MNTSLKAQRGSALLVALIFAALVAAVLASYLTTATSTLKVSQRAFLATDAVNISEAGLEQGLWCFNQMAVVGSTTAWADWSPGLNSSDRRLTFSGFALSQSASGAVKVYVENYDPVSTATTPVIIAKATVTPATGAPIIKWVKCELTRRSLFGRGGVARNGFVFKGNNPYADSWNSKRDSSGNLRAAPAAYSNSNKRDKVTLSAISVDAAISGQNANIYGTVSLGAANNSAGLVSIGPNGNIGPFGTPNGTIDPDSILYNFTIDLKIPTDPSSTSTYYLPEITTSTTLPRGTDLPDPDDGKYYYSVSDVNLSGNAGQNLLTIASPSTVVLLADSGVSIKSGGSLQIETGAKIEIYTARDVIIGGSIDNVGGSAYCDSVAIFGTSTTIGSQNINLQGNGNLSAVVDAPNAAMKLNGGGSGNGNIYGSFIGDTVLFTGNDSFHYDESLAENTLGGAYQPSKWRELVNATDRALYTTQLDSW